MINTLACQRQHSAKPCGHTHIPLPVRDNTQQNLVATHAHPCLSETTLSKTLWPHTHTPACQRKHSAKPCGHTRTPLPVRENTQQNLVATHTYPCLSETTLSKTLCIEQAMIGLLTSSPSELSGLVEWLRWEPDICVSSVIVK